MSLELVSFVICPFVQRAVITLKEKHVDFDIIYIDLKNKPEWFKKISPFGKVPLLKIGHEVLFESAIINEYLDETYPPALHPGDPLERAKHRGWIEFGSNLLVVQFKLEIAKDEVSFQQQCEILGSSLASLESVTSNGPYFMGEHFSLLDAAYAPFFMRFEILKKYHAALRDLMPARLHRWGQTLLARDSVKASVVVDFEQRFVASGKSNGSFILADA